MNEPPCTSTPTPPTLAAPPVPIGEYAQTCSRYVQSAVGLPLDFEPETLPLLDHYLGQARIDATRRPETLPLLSAVAGAYLGEVLRRRFDCSWAVEDKDPGEWRIEFDDLPITIRPVSLAREALSGHPDSEQSGIVVAGKDHELVASRLARLPSVTEQDYVALSTRFEVIDLAVDVIRSHRDEVESPIDDEP